MKRLGSIPKWKEVLGFNDGERVAREGSADDSLIIPVGDQSSNTSDDNNHNNNHNNGNDDRNGIEPHTTLPPLPAMGADMDADEARDKFAMAPQVIVAPRPREVPKMTRKLFRTSFSDAPEVVTPLTAPRRTDSGRSSDSGLTQNHVTTFSDLPEPLEFLVQNPVIHRFPRQITFTCTGTSDFYLSPSPPPSTLDDRKPLPSLPPIFYISISESYTGISANNNKSDDTTIIPDVAIHNTADKASPLLAFASFHSVTFTTSITLLPPPLLPNAPPPQTSNPNTPKPAIPTYLSTARAFGNRNQGHRTVKLASSGGIFSAEKYAFSHTLPRTSVLENFEWRHSSSSLVRALSKACDKMGSLDHPSSSSDMDGKLKHSSSSASTTRAQNGGLKLVRCTTGKTVAIFVGDRQGKRADNPRRAVGMMRFVGGEESGQKGDGSGTAKVDDRGLGEEFELLAVMSILCVMERGKRVTEVHRMTLGDGVV